MTIPPKFSAKAEIFLLNVRKGWKNISFSQQTLISKIFSGCAEFIFDNPNKAFQTRGQKFLCHCLEMMEEYFFTSLIYQKNYFKTTRMQFWQPHQKTWQKAEKLLLNVCKWWETIFVLTSNNYLKITLWTPRRLFWQSCRNVWQKAEFFWSISEKDEKLYIISQQIFISKNFSGNVEFSFENTNKFF